MGKFESYPEADNLNDSDITLYNKNSVTHKITFSRLVSLIKNKIAATGLVTSITTGVGLVSGTITSSGLIKCKLKSETPSSLSSTTISTTANRQYAVGVDREGNLSVNVPWQENSTYQNGTAINIVNDTINVVLDDTYTSTSTVKAATANAVRKAYNDAYQNSMRKDGSNANLNVHLNALTVGLRHSGTVGDPSIVCGTGNIALTNGFASGVYTQASVGAHSEGFGTSESNYTNGEYQEYYNADLNISANSYGSHVEGYAKYNEDSGITGIIQANGMGSHAEGCAIGGDKDGIIIASGKGAHAEGYADCTTIDGVDCAIVASGDGSHAEGIGTVASAKGSHAEGIETKATHVGSHAEGRNNRASGENSHAEGKSVVAGGAFAHAEGHTTTASAPYAHAEGYRTTAGGSYSHVGGAYVSAVQKSQLAQGGADGKFNSVSDYGRGVFCVSPNTLYYNSDDTVYFPNGISATVDGGVTLIIELNKYSMYVLYWVSYSGENDSVMNSGMHYITTSKDTNNPLVQDVWSNNIIDGVLPCAITLFDTNKYMFHLMRIL